MISSFSVNLNTVKPVLTATSEQRPPVNNSQTKSGQINFNTNFYLKPSKDRPPLYNGHFFGVPRVAVIDRFDCTIILPLNHSDILNRCSIYFQEVFS